MKKLNKRVVCEDGVSLSVQANQYAYCSPRIDDLPSWSDYSSVEVGFIETKGGKKQHAPESWIEHSDDGTLLSDVYGYVPTSKVKSFIEDHGGEKEAK